MNVIEFFIAYWDWYLLMGLVVSAGFVIGTGEDESTGTKILGLIILAFLWPILFSIFFFGAYNDTRQKNR